MNILVAESGGTKTDWAFISKDQEHRFQSQGINPNIQSSSSIAEMLSEEVLPELTEFSIEKIFFYGSGCSNPDRKDKLRRILNEEIQPSGEIEVEHDLLAAARALCFHDKGIACILGTGSNSCKFNGKTIELNIGGHGFVLGDEGSGVHLGKLLLNAYLNQSLESDMMEVLNDQFGLDKVSVYNAVYQKENPHKFLSSFAKYVHQHKDRPAIKQIIQRAFNGFIETHLLHYPKHTEYPIHFVGSIAHHFKGELEIALEKYEMKIGKVTNEPINELIEYHKLA